MTKTTNCGACGAQIFLVKTGKTNDSYKWLTNPNRKETWRCGHDPQKPLTSHHPPYDADGNYQATTV